MAACLSCCGHRAGVHSAVAICCSHAAAPVSGDTLCLHPANHELQVCFVVRVGSLLAIENFFYTASALQLPRSASLSQLEDAAAQFCLRQWDDTLKQQKPVSHDQTYLYRYCFGSAFVWTLLHDVFKVSPHLQLQFTNTLQRPDGSEVGLDWALGAAVLELSGQAAQARWKQQTYVLTALMTVALLATLMLLAVAIGVAAQSMRARQVSSLNGLWRLTISDLDPIEC